MHFITLIKIKNYNLFYKYIQLQNTIYFKNINILFFYFFTHKYIQLQNRIRFTFTHL